MAAYNYFRFDRYFKANAPRGPKRFLEIGCGASAWLVYFADEFGYSVSGIDYSELGCELARENLRLNRVKGTCECRDLLSVRPNEMGVFDLIFSYGVVEHFERPDEVLRILTALLAPGGWIVTIVPNMGGLCGTLQRWWNEPVYRMHNVLSPAQLERGLSTCGLGSVMTRYFGTFFLSVVNWSLPQTSGALRRLVPRIIGRFDRYITAALRKLKIEGESRLFSPYVLAVGVKPPTQV